MSPTVEELLAGNARAMAEPAPPEAAGGFAASKAGIVNLIATLVAQEVERGVSVRVSENRAIRALLSQARDWAPPQSAKLAELANGDDPDHSIPALDRTNAELRAALIALHAAVEEDPAGAAHERVIVRLLRDMAQARHLDLPGRARGG
jgi:hypothetical protein